MATGPFKITQCHLIWYQSKACTDFLYALSRTVCELLQCIHHNIVFDMGCAYIQLPLNSGLQTMASKDYKHHSIVSCTN